MQTAREKILHYAQNCAAAFGWSRKKSINHIVETHPQLVREAIAEDERRKFENPGRFFMEEMKQYDKESHESKVKMFSRLFKENPITASFYEQQVKGGDGGRFQRDSAELAEKAHAYSKKHGVDLKTAIKTVLIENPELAESWHFASKTPAKSERRYQNEDVTEPSPIAELRREARKVQAALGLPFRDALMEVTKENSSLVKRAAGEWVVSEVEKLVSAKPGSPSREIVTRDLLAKHPDIKQAWNVGTLTDSAAELILGSLRD